MIRQALDRLNIAALNEMQEAAIRAADKNDVVLLSPTGSGKTLGFLLPVLKRLKPGDPGVQALILVPSRELALQIESVFRAAGSPFKVNCCYGGHSFKTELNNLSHPPAVLIGTPGRIADHLQRESFQTDSVHTLVLDEFDKALELGFQDDMQYIISKLPGLSRRILTSATRMDAIPGFAGLADPAELDFLGNGQPVQGLNEKMVLTSAPDKADALFALLCKVGEQATLVFCNHREAVDRVSEMLYNRGLEHDVFHGGMEQEDRERTLIKFRNGSHRLLITTDLASRGLDIPEIANVIHYQLPVTREAYIHRNGRTARMHAGGTSYLILTPEERPKYLEELPEEEAIPEFPVLPPESPWVTLYLAAGKKDKVNKVDIVGLLLKKGGLAPEDVGRIEVLDKTAYAAVKRERAASLLKAVANEKIKNKKINIQISR